jgi:hypothetical protein
LLAASPNEVNEVNEVGYRWCILWLLRLFLFEKLGKNEVVEAIDFGTNQQKKLRRSEHPTRRDRERVGSVIHFV